TGPGRSRTLLYFRPWRCGHLSPEHIRSAASPTLQSARADPARVRARTRIPDSDALEHKNQPEFRRFDYISAYGEGWALYCEKLGQEMGMYDTPYERFGMLGYQIWRAARLVVDTGVHSKSWTREQALKYMHDYTALPEHE